MRVVFMGSPAFAVPSLTAMHERFSVVGVVTQPDRPAGRGRKLRTSEVKRVALERSLPLFQPANLRGSDVLEHLRGWQPDVIVVAAFGQLIPQPILDMTEHGCVNVHPSLLPRWRGASPIQAAILHGDQGTGVTLMKLDAGLDTGPIIAQRRVRLGSEITGGELDRQLADIGASLLVETLPGYVAGMLDLVPQDNTQATYASAIPKSAGAMDFGLTADELARQVRAYEPRPGSFLKWGEHRLIVRQARAVPGPFGRPGEVLVQDERPAVTTAEGLLVLEVVQPEGKGSMDGASFIRGAPDFVGRSLALPHSV
jgi:methionyl-tRNA formyltransferase